MRSGSIVATPLLGLVSRRGIEQDAKQLVVAEMVVTVARQGMLVVVAVVMMAVVSVRPGKECVVDEGDEAAEK